MSQNHGKVIIKREGGREEGAGQRAAGMVNNSHQISWQISDPVSDSVELNSLPTALGSQESVRGDELVRDDVRGEEAPFERPLGRLE